MKTTLLLTACVALLIVSVNTKASITDVEISPETPTTSDNISFLVTGLEGGGPVTITDSWFLPNGTSLELDIYLDVGMLTVMTSWSHAENIGTLSVGNYDLTVNTYASDTYWKDTFTTSFQVVPEPATLLLLTCGTLCLRKRK